MQRCLRWVVAAVVAPVSAFGSISVAVSVYPNHGLPGVPPAIVAVVRNDGSVPVHLPDGRFCVESSTSATPCDLSPYGADWGEQWFDRQSAPGPFDLNPSQSRTFIADQLGVFVDRAMLTPGPRKLRFRLSFNDTPSNVVTYTVDTPTGANLPVWTAIMALGDPSTLPFLDDRLAAIFAANPTSDYAKLRLYYSDLLSPPSDPADRLKRLQTYLATPSPEAFETFLRLAVPGAYQDVAIDLAKKGLLDQADQQLRLGRSVLQQLTASSNAYAAAVASGVGATGPWTREDLARLVGGIKGTASVTSRPLLPKVNCITVNPDGTFTAWFGYVNQNDAILGIPVGTHNACGGDAINCGQPTSFQPGEQARVFRVTAPVGTKVTWTLLGHPAIATVGDGAQADTVHCAN